ncbi:hypothetical protein ACWDT6_07980 [Nocardia grenadensis]|uniref:hypothetical protein n=1 Tax=Nocardia grenadensis TaxID=931537 RepID=UPI003D72AF8A
MFELNVPVHELSVDSREPRLYVSGRVWLTIDGYDFPERDWSDNVLSFLGSLRHAIENARNGGEEADFYFWEGSYFVKLVPIPVAPQARHVEVFAVNDGGRDLDEGGDVEASCVCTFTELDNQLQATLGELSRWARHHQETELLEFLRRIKPSPDIE